MTEVKELTELTKSILERIEELKINIKNSMMSGEINILRGIIIFEVILKELNPDVLDDNEITKIEDYVRKYLNKKEYDMQKINSYVHYGVNRCFLVLETFNRDNNKKLEKKSNFIFTFK